MLLLLIILYSLGYLFLASKYFRWAVGWFIVLLPTYLIRFNIGHLPTTLLELNFGVLCLAWLIRYHKTAWSDIKKFVQTHRRFSILVALFFIASILGIIVSDQWYISLGQWRAYFLEPIILFILLTNTSGEITPEGLINPLIISTISISIVALIQRFTGQLFPPSIGATAFPGRVTSFFTSPNDIGLYSAPLLALTVYALIKRDRFSVGYLCILLLSLLALLFSKSLGAFVAIAAGIIISLVLLGHKKIAVGIVVASLLLFALPPVRHLLVSKDKSTANRFVLWHYSEEFFTASPKNFILGAGIRQFFRKIQKPHYNVKEMERLIYPHNILLNFWSETGLFGMLSFAGILFLLFYTSYKIYKKNNPLLGAALLACLTIFLVHGLVDVPYFKNDLACLFWMLAALIIITDDKKKISL